MPEAFVRIGSVPPREIHLPVTVVGNWGSEGIARIGPATNEVSPKKLKTGACQQPGSLVDPTLRGRGVCTMDTRIHSWKKTIFSLPNFGQTKPCVGLACGIQRVQPQLLASFA